MWKSLLTIDLRNNSAKIKILHDYKEDQRNKAKS